MFLLVRLLRPLIARASGRALAAGAAALAAVAIVLIAAGVDTHDRIELRIGIALVVAGALSARAAVRGGRARG